ncbi:Uncharacterised protein [Mycobacterium tuberculosis]|nr:Uncharacterised protein [Mycobacterium tuberculosis]
MNAPRINPSNAVRTCRGANAMSNSSPEPFAASSVNGADNPAPQFSAHDCPKDLAYKASIASLALAAIIQVAAKPPQRKATTISLAGSVA